MLAIHATDPPQQLYEYEVIQVSDYLARENQEAIIAGVLANRYQVLYIRGWQVKLSVTPVPQLNDRIAYN